MHRNRFYPLLLMACGLLAGCVGTGMGNGGRITAVGEGAIEKQILQYTPLGSSIDDVESFARDEIARTGNRKASIEKPVPIGKFTADQSTKGVTAMGVWYGSCHHFPFTFLIYCEYTFDRSGKLVEVIANSDME